MPTSATACRYCKRAFSPEVKRHCASSPWCDWCSRCVASKEAECKAAKEKP